MNTQILNPGQKVTYPRHGVTVQGQVVSGPSVFYPDSTVTKYGAGSMGRGVLGYQVRGPIVAADGTVYMVRGQMAPGIYYVAASDLTA